MEATTVKARATFSGGVHPVYNKELTSTKPAVQAAIPKRVIIPLSQHIGAPDKPLVVIDQEVKKGQQIGEGTDVCKPGILCVRQVVVLHALQLPPDMPDLGEQRGNLRLRNDVYIAIGCQHPCLPGLFEGSVELDLNTVTDGDAGGSVKGMVNLPLPTAKPRCAWWATPPSTVASLMHAWKVAASGAT